MTKSRLFIRRKSGYMSPYPLSMFYGAYRAGVYFQNGPHHAPFVRLGAKYHKIPASLMRLFQPFNNYTHTGSGEKFT